MAKFNGFSAGQMTEVSKAYRAARQVLETIVSSKLGSKQFRDVFGRIVWLG
jgi:hypothetical protein